MNNSVVTQQHENILEIAINRPEAYNALNLDVMVMLSDALASAATDASIKGIMLTCTGKAFCSGGDLKWINQQVADAGATLHRLAPQFHIAITEIRRMHKPVVAAINGIAAGGGFSLALARLPCDGRVDNIASSLHFKRTQHRWRRNVRVTTSRRVGTCAGNCRAR